MDNQTGTTSKETATIRGFLLPVPSSIYRRATRLQEILRNTPRALEGKIVVFLAGNSILDSIPDGKLKFEVMGLIHSLSTYLSANGVYDAAPI